MLNNIKNYFQDIHYLRKKPNFFLNKFLGFGEFFYKFIINCKNFLYEKEFLKEKKVDAYVICIGNLTTGGVGKTPIVIELANKISKEKKVAIISRGYKSKLSSKVVNIIKDSKGIKFFDGCICGDEPFQIAKKVSNNVVVITSSNRYMAAKEAIIKYGSEVIILDDGFSNRLLKKDKTILVVDSKMRFGNNHLLPKGPLREPVNQVKRANEVILVDKNDIDIVEAINFAKNFNKPLKVCKMTPKRIYNSQTKAKIKYNIQEYQKAVAFCAIGQPEQFFTFLQKKYNVVKKIFFEDHHTYTKKDIDMLIKTAKTYNTNIFIMTQKDETKIQPLIKDIKGYSFNVLELKNIIEDIM